MLALQHSISKSFIDSIDDSNAAAIEFIEEQINKKRSIEISVEEDSVSVVLFDIAAGEDQAVALAQQVFQLLLFRQNRLLP